MKKLISLVLALIFAACSLTLLANATDVKDIAPYACGTVTATSLNVRSGPGMDKGIIGGLTKDKCVFIIGKDHDSNGGNWYRINYLGQEGYVMGNQIGNVQNVTTGVVIPPALNVRAEPDTASSRVGGFKKDDRILIVGEATANAEDWYKIFYHDKLCYVMASQITYTGNIAKFPSETVKKVGYKTGLTVKITIADVPQGCRLLVGSGLIEPQEEYCDEMSATIVYTELQQDCSIHIAVTDNEGHVLEGCESDFTIDVDDGIFAKIAWFFKFVFNGFKNPSDTVEFR